MRRFAALLALAALAVLGWRPDDGTTRKDVPVRMRDGTVLRADVLLPSSQGRFPVLVYRTPYGKHNAPASWTTFPKAVSRGYAVVLQDVRGRYASEGEFDPYRSEGRDGYDTIEWAAAQSWSDGRVGTFGLSYPGAVQWLAAVEDPPHLKAMVPAMTFATPRNFFYSGGVFDGSWLDWIWFNIAPEARRRAGLPGPQNRKEAAAAWDREHERMQTFLPLSELPDLKDVAPFYFRWLEHRPDDPWWDWAELRGKYRRVRAAVLNLSGWYDEAYGPDGATANFNGLVAARGGQGDPRTATVIGPWTHGELASSQSGDREFGDAARLDYDQLILDWMDRYVKGLDNGIEKQGPVRIFVMGENRWRREAAWPLERARRTTLFLSSADPGGGSLLAAPPAGAGRFSEFLSDPAHPLTDPYAGAGARDYRSFAGRPDVLVFDSEPLRADTEVTGPVRAELYVSSEVPDFDLWTRLVDVAPDGTAFNLMSPGLDVLRASYRKGRKAALLRPGQIVRMELDRLLTSNVFKAGHRIRLQVSGAFFPHFSRNLQTGESEATSSALRAGRIRIHHDPRRRSRIELPVVER